MITNQTPSHAFPLQKEPTLMPLPKDEQMANSNSWRLVSSLISALEVDDLLQRFFKHLQEQDLCEAVVFRNEALEIDIQFGIPGRCRAQYRLDLEGDYLGQILISRRRRYKEEDLRYLEQAIGLMVHPLHNAMRFRSMRINALRDPLTQLHNRMAMNDYLQQEMALLSRYGDDFTLMLLDVDNFKHINDQLGHAAGDFVLEKLACRLRDVCRSSDGIFRYGGDEFVVAMPRANQHNARGTAERLRAAVADIPFMFNGHAIDVEISLGLASYLPGETAQELISRADSAMYTSKTLGRNRCSVYEGN